MTNETEIEMCVVCGEDEIYSADLCIACEEDRIEDEAQDDSFVFWSIGWGTDEEYGYYGE